LKRPAFSCLVGGPASSPTTSPLALLSPPPSCEIFSLIHPAEPDRVAAITVVPSHRLVGRHTTLQHIMHLKRAQDTGHTVAEQAKGPSPTTDGVVAKEAYVEAGCGACAGGEQAREACSRLLAVPLAAWHGENVGRESSAPPPASTAARTINQWAAASATPSCSSKSWQGQCQGPSLPQRKCSMCIHKQVRWMDISPARQVCPTQPRAGMMYSFR
jgi:hypothetical protein